MPAEHQTLEVSWEAILKIILTFFTLYVVFLIHDILILSVFGLVITILFEAPARALSRRMPRWMAVVFLYLATFVVLSFLIYLPASSLVAEIRQFIELFPLYFEKVSPPLRRLGLKAFEDLENFVKYLEQVASVISSNIFSVLFSIFGGVASTIYVISISFFLSLEGDQIEKVLVLFFPKKDRKFVFSLWNRSEKKVGYWFLRIVLGCIFLGFGSYVSYRFMGVENPVSLAVLGGAANFVPMIGPALGVVGIFLMLAIDSVSEAFLGALIYLLLQQIEDNILAPFLFKKFTGLSPVLVLVSLTAGGKLFGVLGAVLMVPLVGVVFEFVKGILERRRERLDAELENEVRVRQVE